MKFSSDFRKKVLQVQSQEGLTDQKTAERFGIGKSTVCGWRLGLLPKKPPREQGYNFTTFSYRTLDSIGTAHDPEKIVRRV